MDTRTKKTTPVSRKKNKPKPFTMSMVSTRARQGNKGLGQIEDLRLQNAAINNEARRKKEEEVERLLLKV